MPATSANLGPGFDAFGLCLGLYDDLAATATETGLVVDVAGEGAESVPLDEQHLVIRAMRATFDLLGVAQPGLSLAAENRIPHARGLGSSAAAIVAGIRLAQALAPDVELGADDALSLAVELEGHPDNVAACLFGGLTIAWTDLQGSSAARVEVDARVRATVLVPGAGVSTEVARGILPETVPHRAASANAGRAGLLVAALTGQPELLHPATRDWLHQKYRRPAMPATLQLVTALRDSGVAAMVSGAGPSVLVLGTADSPAYDALVPVGWDTLALAIDGVGCVWTPVGAGSGPAEQRSAPT
ncbi:MAG TPA: homoserine kinase [Nocardioidaceae bacterium]